MAEVVFTDRADGDFGVDRAAGTLDGLRRGVFDEEWTWLRQVHGAEVVVVDRPGHRAGATADAAVTGATGAVLCVQTADCVPVVLVGDGVVGVAHAGWRGLVAGVIGSTVDARRAGTTLASSATAASVASPATSDHGSAAGT